jgi:hypothetical protein
VADIRLQSGQWDDGANGGEYFLATVMAAHVVPFAVAASAVPTVAMAVAARHVTAVRAAVPDLNHRAILLSGKRRDPRQGGSGQGHCQRSDHRRADQNDTSHAGISPPLERGV